MHYALSVITIVLRSGSHLFFVSPQRLFWLSVSFRTCVTNAAFYSFFPLGSFPLYAGKFFMSRAQPRGWLFSARWESGVS